ncbi:hypothetical protein DMI70_18200 [Escherichia coli]|nr:hypothetical protein [Escherichia coli]
MTDYASFAKVSSQIGRLLVTQLRFLCSGEACQINTAISRRRLLQGAGAMWLLSVSQVSGCGQPVVAVRVWPASSYTRVTVESNRQLKYKQFALSNPERVVVDIEDVNLNSVLKGMAAQIRADDPFISRRASGNLTRKPYVWF